MLESRCYSRFRGGETSSDLPLTVSLPVRSDYRTTPKGALSLSRSRWLSPSALFPFQGPSQSERVFASRITPRGSRFLLRALRPCRFQFRLGFPKDRTISSSRDLARAWCFGLFALLPFGMASTPSSFEARLGITHASTRFGLHRILQVFCAASRRRDPHD